MKVETDIDTKESIPSKESCKKRKCDQFVRIVATIVCLILFFANSFVIFKQCISGKTIVFSDFNEKEDQIYFPLIVICNYSAYKNTELAKLNLDNYRRNTLEINEILDSVYLGFLYNHTDLINETFHSEDLKVWPILTYYRGSCYCYKYKKKVPAQAQLNFAFYEDSDIWVYLIEPSYRFFLHYDYWPDPMPPVFRVGKHVGSLDVNIKKTERHRKKNCKKWNSRAYTKCLVRSFKKFVLTKKQTYPNCSTPWHESMLENENYSLGNAAIDSCNENEKQNQVRMDISFIKYSLTSKDAKCKEPCNDVTYEARTMSYDTNTFVSINSDIESPKSVVTDREEAKIGTEILFYYSTTSIQILTQDTMINFSNFVSAVGGNLGLFVGFSFLGFFSCFYQTSKQLCNNVYSI